MGKGPPKWLPGERVNETILMQRKSVAQLKLDKHLRKDKVAKQRENHKNKIDAKRKRKVSTKRFISAQTILAHAQRQKREARTFHKIGEKAASKMSKLGAETLAKSYEHSGVALLVRAKGNLVSKDIRTAFGRLGLDKLYSARFIQVGPATSKVLRQLRPFAILGFPNPAQVEQLLRTRGCLWNSTTKTKRFISGNRLLEEALGSEDILCIEDLSTAISTKVANLPAILKKLAAFDFQPPRQLFTERHRSKHERLEIVNPASFSNYINDQIGAAMRTQGRENRQLAKDAAAQTTKIDAAKKRAEAVAAAAKGETTAAPTTTTSSPPQPVEEVASPAPVATTPKAHKTGAAAASSSSPASGRKRAASKTTPTSGGSAKKRARTE